MQQINNPEWFYFLHVPRKNLEKRINSLSRLTTSKARQSHKNIPHINIKLGLSMHKIRCRIYKRENFTFGEFFIYNAFARQTWFEWDPQ